MTQTAGAEGNGLLNAIVGSPDPRIGTGTAIGARSGSTASLPRRIRSHHDFGKGDPFCNDLLLSAPSIVIGLFV